MKKLSLFFLLFFVVVLSACGSSYTISFETNTDTEIDPIVYTKGDKLELPSPEREGYVLEGWFTDSDLSKPFNEDGEIISNLTLYAKWEVAKFEVKFVDGTTELAKVTVEYGKDATAPADPEKEGHTFTGWDKEFKNVKADLVVNAEFDKHEYDVKFLVDGEQVGETQVVKYGEAATAPADPEKVGHEFTGWDVDFENITEDLVVNAEFVADVFEVVFKADGVQIGETQIVEYGKAAIAPADPTKDGLSFTGWDVEFDNITEDLVVNAIFELLEYEVKFMVDGEQVGETQIVTRGEDAIAPADPEKEGHIFTSWSREFTNVTENLVIIAVFEVITYEVKFMVDGEQYGATQVVDHGLGATRPTANPAKEGHTFIGWDKEFAVITEDLVVNAMFQVRTFTVKFYDASGVVLHEEIVNYGEDATAPADPTRAGYTFKKWSNDFTNVKQNITALAEFDIIEYTITYYSGDNNLELTPNKYTVEDEVELPIYAADGYIFVGWHKEADLSDLSVSGIAKGTTGNLTLYLNSVDASQTLAINYDLNGGTWGWTTNNVAVPGNGIDPYSNLPDIFMQDFFVYLRDNNLLSSTLVDEGLRKTTWATFSANYEDPRAIYNWSSSATFGGGYGELKGYILFFLDSGTGNVATGEIFDLVGGFFGTDGYKEKYATLAQYVTYLTIEKYSVETSQPNQFWQGGNGLGAFGFVLDGYFYGTQEIKSSYTDRFKAMRAAIPTPTKGYNWDGSKLVEYAYDFLNDEMVVGLETVLSIPSREGYFFEGWYTNADFTGERVYKIPGNENPAAMYYAKWVVVG